MSKRVSTGNDHHTFGGRVRNCVAIGRPLGEKIRINLGMCAGSAPARLQGSVLFILCLFQLIQELHAFLRRALGCLVNMVVQALQAFCQYQLSCCRLTVGLASIRSQVGVALQACLAG